MRRVARALRRALFGMPPREATFVRRQFVQGDVAAMEHLERIGFAFLHGYNSAIANPEPRGFMHRTRSVPLSHVGFCMEGGAMAFALLDQLSPAKHDRLERFIAGEATDHLYMAHVGAGWALARLPHMRFAMPMQRALGSMDPLLRWLAVDGYGFHQGYFRGKRSAQRLSQPRSIRGTESTMPFAARAFDQGLGRSLWFSECADPWRVSLAIQGFPAARRADLWSGVGLACTYAGGVSDAGLAALAHLGAGYCQQIAQGAAFAAKTRLRAGNLVEHTARACRVLCQCEPNEAAAVTDSCLSGLTDGQPDGGHVPAFEIWRRRIAAHFSSTVTIPQLVS